MNEQFIAGAFLKGVLIIGGSNLVTGIFIGWIIWG